MNRLLSRIRDTCHFWLRSKTVIRQFRLQHEEHGGWSIMFKDYSRESIDFPEEPSSQFLHYLRKKLDQDSTLRFDSLKWENGRLIAWRTDPTI